MKIQITTSTWARGDLIEPQIFNIDNIVELKEAVDEVITLLKEERKTLPSWKSGFDPKFNVTYRITNSDFSYVKIEYDDIRRLSNNMDLKEFFMGEVKKCS